MYVVGNLVKTVQICILLETLSNSYALIGSSFICRIVKKIDNVGFLKISPSCIFKNIFKPLPLSSSASQFISLFL